jgi:transposase
VAHRTRIINQIRAIIVTSPDHLRERLDPLPTHQLIEVCARFRPGSDITDPTIAAKHSLKTLARQHSQLGADVEHLTTLMTAIVTGHAPRSMLEMTGVGPIVASDILIAWGSDPDRITSEAAFAALCGVSAVEASSGEHVRHRLNRGGDRQANAALYRMVIVRLRFDPATRAYMQRRLADGRTKKEIVRCLKRYAARDLYHHLKHPN